MGSDLQVQKTVVHNFLRILQSTFPTQPSTVEMAENMKFISRLEQDIALVRYAHSWDILFTLEINFIFPRNHVIFSM